MEAGREYDLTEEPHGTVYEYVSRRDRSFAIKERVIED